MPKSSWHTAEVLPHERSGALHPKHAGLHGGSLKVCLTCQARHREPGSRCRACELEHRRARSAARARLGPLYGPPLPSEALARRLRVAGQQRRRAAILADYAAGTGPSMRTLAGRYGVSIRTVHRVIVEGGVHRRTPGRPKVEDSERLVTPQPPFFPSQSLGDRRSVRYWPG